MDAEEIQNRIFDLEREISRLPQGSLTTKKINGNVYFYRRISVNGKRKELYVNFQEASGLKSEIERRRQLEKELKELKAAMPSVTERCHGKNAELKESASEYVSSRTYLRTGEALRSFAVPAASYKRRTCFDSLKEYLQDTLDEKVMILYGLRRTGKTTLIRQLIAEMPEEERAHAVFMQIKASDTMADVNADLKMLERQHYRYVFIDEVTLMEDFVEGAALFSDIFAASGMKIILSGTDSLGFLFSEDEQLFDRCRMIHTTFISYGEFERVLGKCGIDEYIRYGGTMCPSGAKYNEDAVFSSLQRTNEYVDSAIAKNIQHSLSCYQDGGHFRSLRQLYDSNELTSAINRVVEDMNHRFTVSTLTRTFRSGDLALSAGNLRRDRSNPTDILDRIDVGDVTEKLKKTLEILNREEQKTCVSEIHAAEIEEYLKLLDLVVDIPVEQIPRGGEKTALQVISQPGLRYVQADALVQSLLSDRVFDALDIVQKSAVIERIRSEIKGRLMEEIVLLETKLAKPEKQIFKLQFTVGEFDMVVFDPEALCCCIYEIKHSAEPAPAQYRHLLDKEKCAAVEHRYGRIMGRYVIYRGQPCTEYGVEYLNVEEYLRQL